MKKLNKNLNWAQPFRKRLIKNSGRKAHLERKNNKFKILGKLPGNFNKIPKLAGFTVLAGVLIAILIFGMLIVFMIPVTAFNPNTVTKEKMMNPMSANESKLMTGSEPSILHAGIGNGDEWDSEFQPGTNIIFYALINKTGSNYPVNFSIRNPSDTEIFNTTLYTDSYGFVPYEYTSPEGEESGEYRAKFSIGDDYDHVYFTVSSVSFIKATWIDSIVGKTVSFPILVESSYGSRIPYNGKLNLNVDGMNQEIDVANGAYMFNTTVTEGHKDVYINNVSVGNINSINNITYYMTPECVDASIGDTINYVLLFHNIGDNAPRANINANIESYYWNDGKQIIFNKNFTTDSNGFIRFNFTIPDISSDWGRIIFDIRYNSEYIGDFDIDINDVPETNTPHYSFSINEEDDEVVPGGYTNVTIKFRYWNGNSYSAVSNVQVVLNLPYQNATYAGITNSNGEWKKNIQLPSSPQFNSYEILGYTIYKTNFYYDSANIDVIPYRTSPDIIAEPNVIGENLEIRFRTHHPQNRSSNIPNKQIFGSIEQAIRTIDCSWDTLNYMSVFSGITNSSGEIRYFIPMNEYGRYHVNAYHDMWWTRNTFYFLKYKVNVTANENYPPNTEIEIPVKITNRETGTPVANVLVEGVLDVYYKDILNSDDNYPSASCTTNVNGVCILKIKIPLLLNDGWAGLNIMFSDGYYSGVIKLYGFKINESNVNCSDNDGDGSYVKTSECPVEKSDCNDNDVLINPRATEIYCNGVDENCNGIDECGCIDNDGDGSYAQIQQCPTGSDCNDSNSSIYPGAPEINCNGIDEDCNGFDQCNCINNDHDGYNESGTNCGLIDCDGENINIHPDANEIHCNGLDENCNGMVDDCVCYDNDHDGDNGSTAICPIGTDCDDYNEDIKPNANEVCDDNIDNNCNGIKDEGCDVDCTLNDDCRDGKECINNECTCPNGEISVKEVTICDPVGVPTDTSCTEGWPYHQGSDMVTFTFDSAGYHFHGSDRDNWRNYIVVMNEPNYACDLFEVTRNDLLVHAEKARNCCIAEVEGTSTSGCHKFVDNSVEESGLKKTEWLFFYDYNINYNNFKKCIGLYEFYGNGPGEEYMQEYYWAERDCGNPEHPEWGGCFENHDASYCSSNIQCGKKRKNWPFSWYTPFLDDYPYAKDLKCQGDVGTPNGWANDMDMSLDSCIFSDLPAHASINIISTGTCVDYSVALTTLLRMSGYKNDEIYSITGPDHGYNLIKFPGDHVYTIIDTVKNVNRQDMGGKKYSGTPYCSYSPDMCANDNGQFTCPGWIEVKGCSKEIDISPAGMFASPLNSYKPSNFTINSTSTSNSSINVTRTVYNSVYIGEILTVNITVENNNNYPINVTINELMTNAEVYQDLIIPENPPGMIATPPPYITFNDTILANDKKSFVYGIKPLYVGDYIHSSTEIYTNNVSLHIDTQTTEVKCISNGICGENGENYINCLQDCRSGAEDGICNSLTDDQCDKDCIKGLDDDCLWKCDLNQDGIIIHDYNDLLTAHKCFLGINKNCNKINFRDWNSMKEEYKCFTDTV